MIAARELHPAAIIDLSGERDLTGLLPGVTLDSYAAAPTLRTPALFVVARDDSAVSVADMRADYRHASSPVKQLIVLPASAGHGWDMLLGPHGRWPPLAHQILRFIQRHTT